VLFAYNYFAFRVELFDNEYKENHPERSDVLSIGVSSLNWETFDKDNAPKAFVIHADGQIEFLCYVAYPLQLSNHSFEPYRPVRDKSPPRFLFS